MKPRLSREKKELLSVIVLGVLATSVLLFFSWPFLYRVVIAPIFRRAAPRIISYDGPLMMGEAAPDLILTDTRGKSRRLSEMIAGKTAVLFFFAAWCEPCGGQLTDMAKLEREFSDVPLALLTIHMDITEHPERGRELAERMMFSLEDVYFERDTRAEKHYLANDRAIPLMVFVGEGGKVADIARGHVDYNRMITGVRAALGK